MTTRIPISREETILSFEDRQKQIWKDMEIDMEKRRRGWESEIDQMRNEFFKLRPQDDIKAVGDKNSRVQSSFGSDHLRAKSPLMEATSCSSDNSFNSIFKDDKGNPIYKIKFDLHEYRPEEVSVKMDVKKLIVSARHETKEDGSTVSSEYNREMTLPHDIDSMTLECIMGPDGVLTIEAPLRASSSMTTEQKSSLLAKPTSFSPPSTSGYLPILKPSLCQNTQSCISRQCPAKECEYITGLKPASVSDPSTSSAELKFLSDVRHGQGFNTSSMYESNRKTSGVSSTFPATSPPDYSHHEMISGRPSRATYDKFNIDSLVATNKPGIFNVEIDIGDFKPEELIVKTQDQRILVTAKHEDKSDMHSCSQELSREHTIPYNVDPLSIRAFFSTDKKLIIEAPYKGTIQM